jgi:hypothetical protein
MYHRLWNRIEHTKGTPGWHRSIGSSFSICLGIVSILMQDRYSLRWMSHRHRNLLRHSRWYFELTLVKWKHVSVYLEIILISTQGRCTVWSECTIGSKIALSTPKGYSWVTQVKCKINFSLFEIVSFFMQDRCTVCVECTIGSEIILMHPMVLLVTLVKWKFVSVRLEIVLILAQDRCTVCAECTTGMKILPGTPDGTSSWCWLSGSLFRSIRR